MRNSASKDALPTSAHKDEQGRAITHAIYEVFLPCNCCGMIFESEGYAR
jgi:hypothetical protein